MKAEQMTTPTATSPDPGMADPGSVDPGMAGRELQEFQRSILRRFDRACRRHGLRYFTHGGTLLGSVLYQDFIPWDDDVDVSMPRPDFERFVALADDPDLAGMEVLDARTHPDYPFAYAKVGATGTRLVDVSSGGRELPINIDVFPLDGLAPEGWRRWWQRAVRWVPHQLIVFTLDVRATGWRKPIVRGLGWVGRRIGVNRLARALRRTAIGWDFDAADQVALLAWGPAPAFDRESFDQSVDLPFGELRLPAPAGHHDVLTRGFGPQWVVPLPPSRQHSPHTFRADREGTEAWLREHA